MNESTESYSPTDELLLGVLIVLGGVGAGGSLGAVLTALGFLVGVGAYLVAAAADVDEATGSGRARTGDRSG